MDQECTHNTQYPSDMSDAEWELMRTFVDVREHLGAPRTVCLRCVLNALFYKNKTGRQWKMIPHEYPHPSTVYWYFKKWTDNGTWKRINDAFVRRYANRPAKNRRQVSSLLIAKPSRPLQSAVRLALMVENA